MQFLHTPYKTAIQALIKKGEQLRIKQKNLKLLHKILGHAISFSHRKVN